MSNDLERRLREIHAIFCDNGFQGDPCSIGCEFSAAIETAARIGAEVEREECAKVAEAERDRFAAAAKRDASGAAMCIVGKIRSRGTR